MKLLPLISNIVALAGVLLCLVAGFLRLSGTYHFAGFEVMTFFDGGSAVMIFACLLKLHLIQVR